MRLWVLLLGLTLACNSPSPKGYQVVYGNGTRVTHHSAETHVYRTTRYKNTHQPKRRTASTQTDPDSTQTDTAAAIGAGILFGAVILGCILSKSCGKSSGSGSGVDPEDSRGCCSHHDGIDYVYGNTVMCKDGSRSPTCH